MDEGFALSFVAKFFTTCVFYLYVTTLTMYLSERHPVVSSASGLAVGLFIFGSTFGRIGSVWLEERMSRRWLLLVWATLFVVFSGAYFLPLPLAPFMLLRLLHGVSFGVVNNAVTVITTDLLPPDRLGEGLGVYALSATLAAVVAPTVGVAVIDAFSYRAVFAISFAFSLMAFVAIAMQRSCDMHLPENSFGDEVEFCKGGRLFERNAVPNR